MNEEDNFSFSKTFKSLQAFLAASSKKLLVSLTNPETQKVAVSSVLFTSTIAILLVVATLIYSCFYIISMPKVTSAVPIYFDYSHSQMAASSSLNLQAGSRYNLGLLLYTPDTTHNYELGNFMVKLDLLSPKNKSLVTVSRPAHLRYQSELLRTLKTWFNLFSLVLDYKVQESVTKVELLENYFESLSDPSSYVKITISNPTLHTYSAKLLVDTHFQGLAYFMYNWWLSTALFFISNIMLAEILFISYLWSIVSELVGDSSSEKVVDGQTEFIPSESQSESKVSKNTEAALEEDVVKSELEVEAMADLASCLTDDDVGLYSSLAYPRRMATQSGNFSYPYSSDLFDSNATLNRLITEDSEFTRGETIFGAENVPDIGGEEVGEDISDINLCEDTVGESFDEFDLNGLLK